LLNPFLPYKCLYKKNEGFRMHVITGLIFAGLMGRKKDGARSLTPKWYAGPLQTVHAIPGRVRFVASPLEGNQKAGSILKEKLLVIEGVESVEVNPISGSVLIHYQESSVKPELLFAALVRLLGLEKELEKPPQSILSRELRIAGDSLNRAVHEKTGGLLDLWTAVLILLAGVGARKLIQQGMGAFPAGFTLVWWAANDLLRGKHPK
jgi:copper chaperone CopZ